MVRMLAQFYVAFVIPTYDAKADAVLRIFNCNLQQQMV